MLLTWPTQVYCDGCVGVPRDSLMRAGDQAPYVAFAGKGGSGVYFLLWYWMENGYCTV